MMKHDFTQHTAAIFVIGFVCIHAASTAYADALEARLLQDKLQVGEPVVVEVTLHSEKPFAQDNIERQHYLHRRLRAELQQNGVPLCTFPLFGPTFVPVDDRSIDFVSTRMGLVSNHDKDMSQHIYFQKPGTYTLVVRDPETREIRSSPSQEIRLIQPTEKKAVEASQLWLSIPCREMAGVLWNGEVKEKVLETLDQLSKNYAETVYGRYALVCTALIDYKAARKKRDDSLPAWSPTSEKLRKASQALELWHPLTKETLLRLAIAQVKTKRYKEARETAKMLRAASGNSDFADKAKQLLAELDQLESEEGLTK